MKPMLAVTLTLDKLNKLKYPLIASPKLDGIRMIIHSDLGAVTRKLKPIANKHIKLIADNFETGYDGEIIIGDFTDKHVFNKTSSSVMSFDGKPVFKYYIFDNYINYNDIYTNRIKTLKNNEYCEILESKMINKEDELFITESEYLHRGFEGIILRNPKGLYKFNRSTLNEQYLIKFKRFVDDEAVILDVEEKFKNNNEAKINNLGYTERSFTVDNLVPCDTLGSLKVKSNNFANEFNIGTGFTEEMRKEIWTWRKEAVGKTVKYKYQEIGVKDAPRFPVFLGFRFD